MYLSKVIPERFPTTPLQEHQMVWGLFPRQENRNFLFGNYGDGSLYVLSKDEPRSSEKLEIQSRAFKAEPKAGDRLSFHVRIYPRVATTIFHREAGREIKIKQNLLAYGQSKEPKSLMDEWLSKRTERWGFSLPEGYEILDVENWRFRHKNRPIRFHVWSLRGVLEVTDPEKFTQTLKGGIGSGKAFGCGMLMVSEVK